MLGLVNSVLRMRSCFTLIKVCPVQTQVKKEQLDIPLPDLVSGGFTAISGYFSQTYELRILHNVYHTKKTPMYTDYPTRTYTDFFP